MLTALKQLYFKIFTPKVIVVSHLLLFTCITPRAIDLLSVDMGIASSPLHNDTCRSQRKSLNSPNLPSTRLQVRNLSGSTTAGGEKQLKEREWSDHTLRFINRAANFLSCLQLRWTPHQKSHGNEGQAEGGPTKREEIIGDLHTVAIISQVRIFSPRRVTTYSWYVMSSNPLIWYGKRINGYAPIPEDLPAKTNWLWII